MKSAMEWLHVDTPFQKHALVVTELMLLCAAYVFYEATEIMRSIQSPPVVVSMKGWNDLGQWTFCNVVPSWQDHAHDAGLGFFQNYSGNVKIHLKALAETLVAGKSASAAELRISRQSLPVQVHDSDYVNCSVVDMQNLEERVEIPAMFTICSTIPHGVLLLKSGGVWQIVDDFHHFSDRIIRLTAFDHGWQYGYSQEKEFFVAHELHSWQWSTFQPPFT